MFTGSIVAIVTPMDEKGNVCRASLKKLIDYHVASGTSAIVSVGTTGESATLNHDEHADVVMMTLELADGRIPVIAGTGANATAEAISLTQRFNDSGIVGCLTVTPYYNRPSQEGLYQHFKAIAEHTDLPQILYNVPSRTGCDLLPETVGRLAKVKNIIGIKEATGNLTRVLVYFYPKAMTPGCTVQACGLRDNMDELKKAGVDVLGISTDKPEKLSRFAEKELLNFTLLSDEDHQVCEQFGVWGEKSFMGKTYDGIHRISFLIDADGKIEHVFDDFKTSNHHDVVLNWLKEHA